MQLIGAAAGLALALTAMPAAAQERRLALSGFDTIRIEGPIAATLSTGRGTAAVVTGPTRATAQLTARVDGRTLILSTPPLAPVAIRLQTLRLSGAELIGAAALSVDRLTGDDVRLTAQGAARIDVQQMQVRRLDVAATGGSRARLAGRADRVTISTQGAANVDASALLTPELVVASEGDGEIRAQARRSATINALGAGRVTVTGSAECTIQQQGGADVRCGR